MLRRAATRSCSTIAVSLWRASSLAGDSVPQNGQTNRCVAGFHCASPPHAGHWYFACAVTTVSAAPVSGLESGNQGLQGERETAWEPAAGSIRLRRTLHPPKANPAD